MVNKSSGAALLLVLWLVAAMSLIVLSASKHVRFKTRDMAIHLEQLKATPVLDGVVQLVSGQLLKSKEIARRYHWFQIQFGTLNVWIEVTPAAGLIDLNVATPELIAAVLHRVGMMRVDQAQIMAARIKDWIDPDGEPTGPGGAEMPQYRAASWPSAPRNGPMEDPAELTSVMGMTSDAYETIKPFLGLNGQQKLDIEAAPHALIDALAGQSGLGLRLQSLGATDKAALISQSGGRDFFVTSGSSSGEVRLRAYLYANDGLWWMREAWVSLSTRPDSPTPWTTLMLDSIQRVAMPFQDIKP